MQTNFTDKQIVYGSNFRLHPCAGDPPDRILQINENFTDQISFIL